jgi:hypothetical protein
MTAGVTVQGNQAQFGFQGSHAESKVQIKSVSATISFRRPQANTTTQSNTLRINDLSYTLTGASVLNSGLLSYQAIL